MRFVMMSGAFNGETPERRLWKKLCLSARGVRWYRVTGLIFIFIVSCAQVRDDEHLRRSKIAVELRGLYDEYSNALASNRAAGFRAANPSVQIIEDRVVIDAVASGDVNVLKSDLMSLGMREAVAHGRIVSGQLPILAVPALAKLSSLTFAGSASALLQGIR